MNSNNLCKGSWVDTARNIVYNKNKLECELRKEDGSWLKNKISFSSRYEYHNINGKFQWSFDNSILFLIINMEKNKDRWDVINNQFKHLKEKYNCDYIRVEGICGHNIEKDNSAQEILKPKKDLLGKTFTCIESNEKWIYDGTIHKSFPGLHLNGHHGTKGLTLSNMKCFNLINKKYKNYNWYCILEDDSIINENIYNQIINVSNENKYSNDIILLDKRGRGGTCSLLYNQRIINNVILHMHPLSLFSIINERKFKRGTNLWDWKLWSYLDNFIISNKTYPIVSSGNFKSTIS